MGNLRVIQKNAVASSHKHKKSTNDLDQAPIYANPQKFDGRWEYDADRSAARSTT